MSAHLRAAVAFAFLAAAGVVASFAGASLASDRPARSTIKAETTSNLVADYGPFGETTRLARLDPAVVDAALADLAALDIAALDDPLDRHVRQVARTAAAPLLPEEARPGFGPPPVPSSSASPTPTPVRAAPSVPVARPTPTGTPGGGCYYNVCPD